MRSSPAPWIALGSSLAALVFALAGLWTVVANSILATPDFDAIIPTVAASVLALSALLSIRRARLVTPHRRRTRIAIALLVLAVAVDVFAFGGFVDARRRPPFQFEPSRASGPHINLCESSRGTHAESSGGSIGPAIWHAFC
jgi:hypothetical protein